MAQRQNFSTLGRPLKDLFKVSVTHKALARKHLPENSQIITILDSAAGIYKDHLERLKADPTKTDATKKLNALEKAEGLYLSLFQVIDKDRAAAVSKLEELEKKTAGVFTPTNTTDLMIRQQQAAMLSAADLKFPSILKLIADGDVESAKALALPLMQHKYDVQPGGKNRDTWIATSEKAVLGKDYQELVNTRAMIDTLTAIGEESQKVLEKNMEEAAAIKAQIVGGSDD